MVPEGWTVKRVEDTGKVHAGRQRSPHFIDGKLTPYLRVANVFDGHIKTSNVNEMPFTELEYSRYVLRNGDILLNEGQSIELVGRAAMYVGEPNNCCFQNTLIRYQHGSNVEANFALALFQYCQYNGLFSRIATKTNSIAHLGVSRFAELSLPFPPLTEQRKIAEILSTWDRAIEVSEALLATAQTQKRALMQSLLTGKRRFPEFEGQPWKEVRLGDVAQISMGSSPKSSAYNQDGIGLPLIQGNADIKNGWSAPRSFTSETTTICKPNDILLSVRAPVGTIAISGHHACVGRGAAVITPKAGYSWSWLKHVMIDLNPKWVRVSQGSTFDAVNSKDIKSFKIMAPSSLKEQDRIGEAMEVTEWEINSLTDQISKLRTEKKALMQQLLTGKRRVVV